MDTFDPTPLTRRLLVSAASRHGATGEIADHLAGRLRDGLGAAWSVERLEPDDVGDLESFDAVVIGSAIYFGRWLKAARSLLRREPDPPAGLWLFSSGPVGHGPQADAESMPVPAGGAAIEHAVFSGRVDRDGLRGLERVVVAAMRVPSGDHRDWNRIDRWADSIVRHLVTDRPALR